MSYETTLESIEAEIQSLDDKIEIEKKFHKIINSKDFIEIFNETIFGSEMIELSEKLCSAINEESEDEIIEQLRLIKKVKYFIKSRAVQLEVLKSRLEESNELRQNILKQN
jgi:hypothetical protein